MTPSRIIAPRRRGLALPPPLWTPDCELAPWMQPGLATTYRKASGAAWSPSTPSNTLLRWLDGAKTAPVVADSISSWLDNAPTPHTPTNSSSAGPTVGTLGSSPAPIFDGTRYYNDGLAAPSGAQTIAVVFKTSLNPGTSSFTSMLGLVNGSNYTSILLCNYSGYEPISFAVNGTGTIAGCGINPTLDTTAHLLVLVTNGGDASTAGTYTSVLLDNVSKTPVTNSAALYGGTSVSGQLGAGYPSGVANYSGNIGLFCIWNGALGGVDLGNLHTYCVAKFGTP